VGSRSSRFCVDRSGNCPPKTPGTSLQGSRVAEQTYYCWRKEYGGLKLEQARRLKHLEKENARLRGLVTEVSPGKQVLQEVA
jgi:hypothetical protein